jgi:hypothetical protein
MTRQFAPWNHRNSRRRVHQRWWQAMTSAPTKFLTLIRKSINLFGQDKIMTITIQWQPRTTCSYINLLGFSLHTEVRNKILWAIQYKLLILQNAHANKTQKNL